eukprot:gnl/TRDRNA2_/TRDRNA2_45873_c0_seq1.p1 gnl/TRDRNA2_/TRDRNA2_45873_c0~~gnl/TRDRNA2_/TRDRNA2_45873_c0_seq1.p1  ORF type:complete len:1344 (-),score=272.30 gnl/TRDRNA2_/TRDRNA2_45873_c0_seq1:173-4171(-)
MASTGRQGTGSQGIGAGRRKQSAAGPLKRLAGSIRSAGAAGSVPDSDTILAPATSAIPRAEALARLKELSEILSSTQQGQGESLVSCVQAAAGDELLRHPERDVRLWAARCLADGLRIFAPEPPLDAQRVRATLQLFLEQLRSLAEPGSAHFVHAVGLLEQLAEVRAFMLLFDCPDKEELLGDLVSVCVAAARADDAGRLEGLLSQLLVSVLGEVDVAEVPKPALMSLIEELVPKRRSSHAASLVRRTLGDLANRSVSLPINDLLNAALYSPHEADDPQSEVTEQETEALLGAVWELFQVEVSLVARVLPNLQTDLQCADERRRCMVTSLIGRMLSFRHTASGSSAAAQSPLVVTHPLLLDRFFERLDDAADEVRLAALDGAAAVLATALAIDTGGPRAPPAVSAALKNAAEKVRQLLVDRCLDPCDAVRLRVVEVAAEAASSQAGLELLNGILPDIFRRVLDKKPRVREASAQHAARLYQQHALPAWIEGRYKWDESRYTDAMKLAWVPQLLCEAYAVFSTNRLGYTAELEEYLEEFILGRNAKLGAAERARALLGLHAAASADEHSARGLSLLLAKKRDANAALRRFLQLRMTRPSAALEFNATMSGTTSAALVPSTADAPGAPGAAEVAAMALESFSKLSPCMEDKGVRIEAMLTQLRVFDGVKDRALWTHLDRLSALPSEALKTEDMGTLLEELGRLLRVHRITELRPLLRRALLCTWLLPDQVPALLKVWTESEEGVNGPSSLGLAISTAVADLPRYFPGAFLPHAEAIAQHLASAPSEDARNALRALAALGKRAAGSDSEAAGAPPPLDPEKLVEALLGVAAGYANDVDTAGQVCRQAVRSLGLFPADDSWAAVEQLLHWASQQLSSAHAAGKAPSAVALRCAACCIQRVAESPDCPDSAARRAAREPWVAEARAVLREASKATLEAQLAAIELLAACGAEEDLVAVLAQGENADLSLHAAVAVLRGLRHGTLLLNTSLLSHLAAEVFAATSPERDPSSGEALFSMLQKFQKPSKVHTRLADRLRLCSTLPAVFALAPMKRQREAVQRLLTASLGKAVLQGSERKEPLVDYAIACFIHFVSRLPCFATEVAAAASAFPESTKVAGFFVECLLKSVEGRRDPPKSADVAGAALRVTERVRYFVDRENPTSDAIHRAAHVLRYVIEKRCTDIGEYSASLLHGAARGGMPSELFTARQSGVATGDARPAAQETLPAPPRQPLAALQGSAMGTSPKPSPAPLALTSGANAAESSTLQPAMLRRVAGTSPQQVTPSNRNSLKPKRLSFADTTPGDQVSSVARPIAARDSATGRKRPAGSAIETSAKRTRAR